MKSCLEKVDNIVDLWCKMEMKAKCKAVNVSTDAIAQR
jgi:hypothetical protein